MGPSEVDSQDNLPEIVLRIPGRWPGPVNLARSLPDGYELEAGRLHLPDGARVEVAARPPDRDLPELFATSCRGAAPPRLRREIQECKVYVCLVGPGGSLEAATRMMKAGAALIRAGGAGVFVDNSGRAHEPRGWLELARDPDDADAYCAFVSLFGGGADLWSIGMQVFGLSDAVIRRGGEGQTDVFDLTSFLGYTLLPDVVIADGDLAGDCDCGPPRFRLVKEAPGFPPAGTPLHNPYGRWRMVRMETT